MLSALNWLHAFDALARYSAPENSTTSEPRLDWSIVHVLKELAELVEFVVCARPKVALRVAATRKQVFLKPMAERRW